MKKQNRLPHEEATGAPGDAQASAVDGADADVEGHGARSGDGFLPGLPGTGGDELHRPSSGGEVVGDSDVEGHTMGHTKGERLSPGMPGTGGDHVNPFGQTDGDDVEGPRVS